MGNKILVNINTSMEIDEDSLRLSPEHREEDIQDQIKWAIQRVQNGSDERVSWSIDYYLNENMPTWLENLKTNKGTPGKLFTDDEMNNPEGISDEASERAYKEWISILDAMIAGFKSAKEIEENWIPKTEDNELWKSYNKGMDLFKEYYFSLWD